MMSAFGAVILLMVVEVAKTRGIYDDEMLWIFHYYDFIPIEILTAPKNVTIEYGELATFFCSFRIVGHSGFPYWLMNDEPVGFGFSLENDGYRIAEHNVETSIKNSTLLINGSFYKYNNLEVQCGISTLESRRALLKINGKILEFVDNSVCLIFSTI